VGERCPRCRKLFEVGQSPALVPQPPDDPEDIDKMQAGRPYTTTAIPVHWDCATKEEQAA